jgi:predicted flap endonuclease-1-like 5' DNA nuclease
MNQMSSGVTGAITGAQLALIVILAIIAVLMIWWGARRRRQQRAAERQVEERRPTTSDTIAPTTAETPLVDRPPVTPSPPPLVDVPAEPAPPPTVPQATSAEIVPPAPATGGDADAPVTLLKGLGPKVAARLAELGVTTVGQLAALTPAEAGALDADLGTFKGRMARDRWIEQARLLATGDRAGFEATFGKLG